VNQATAVGERWFKAIEKGDADTLRQIVADDIDFLTPAGQLGAPQDVIDFVMGYNTAFPDSKFTIDRWIEQEDVSVGEGTYSGTHTGVLSTPMGVIPPTGKGIAVPFVTIFGERGSQVAFCHNYYDNVGFMTQLGLMPEPGQG